MRSAADRGHGLLPGQRPGATPGHKHIRVRCVGSYIPGAAARYTGGVWVGKFLKTVTYQRMTPEAGVEIGEVAARQCHAERMLAHETTARVRAARYSPWLILQFIRKPRPAALEVH